MKTNSFLNNNNNNHRVSTKTLLFEKCNDTIPFLSTEKVCIDLHI